MRGLNLMLLASLVSLSAEAGSVLKVDSKDDSGKSVPKEVYYAQDGMMRIDSLDAQGSVTRTTLVRDGVIWEIDPRERTFTRIDAGSLKQLFGGGEPDGGHARQPAARQARADGATHGADAAEGGAHGVHLQRYRARRPCRAVLLPRVAGAAQTASRSRSTAWWPPRACPRAPNSTRQ